MKKIIYTMSLLIFVLFGCKAQVLKPNVNSKSTITVDIRNNKSDNVLINLNLNDRIDKVDYIELETTQNNLITQVSKLFFIEDKFVIFDYRSSQIFIFDNKGKYISKINKKGKANDEYIGINKGMYDEKQNQVIVYDGFGRKILYYDLAGNLKRILNNVSDGAIIRDIENLPNGHFLCYRGEIAKDSKYPQLYAGLWELDNEGKFVKFLFEYETLLPLVHNDYNSIFSRTNDGETIIKDMRHSDIYKYSNGEIVRWVNFNMKDDVLSNQIGKRIAEQQNSQVNLCYNLGDYLFMMWLDASNDTFYSVYDIVNNRHEIIDGFIQDKLPVPTTLGFVVDNNSNDKITMSTNREYINASLEKNTGINSEVKNHLKNKLLSNEEKKTFNPIIEIIYLK